MKKRIVIFNSLAIFISLLLMFIVSIIIIYNQNIKSYENYATNYIALITSKFDASTNDNLNQSLEELNNLVLDTRDVRLTVINISGDVVLDSENKEITENHLSREELQPENLGKPFMRYSQTKHQQMLYIASLKNNYFIRIGIAIKDVNQILTVYTGLGTLFLVIIFGLSIYFVTKINNKNFKEVNKNLNKIVDLLPQNDNFHPNSIDDLPFILDRLSFTIKDELKSLNEKKEQVLMILNEINQGVVLINNEKKIVFLNKAFLDWFKLTSEIIGRNYLYLFRDITFQNLIDEALEQRINTSYTLTQNGKTYECLVTNVSKNDIINGVIITLNDVTNAEKVAKIKKDFFQNASHELKSPLTTIIGYLQLIDEGIVEDVNDIKTYTTKTLKEARRMNNIIMDMLDLAFLEMPEEKTFEEVDVKKVLNDIIQSMEGQIKNKNIKYSLDVDDLIIYSNPKLIDELLRNLIDNAIKYNKQNGSIELVLKNNTFLITDTGEGIPSDDIERVFERFYRVSKNQSKNLLGTGLGLAIVKHICELYNYQITLTSSVGVGTKIKVVFK